MPTSAQPGGEKPEIAAEQVGPLELEAQDEPPGSNRLLGFLQVEARGIVPTTPEERTDTRYWKVFFIWFSGNCNILS